jgi:predicted dehydrogenase
MKKIKIATIGVGRFGIYHLHAFKQLEKFYDVELKAASELISYKQKYIIDNFRIPVYEDYLEMIENEDLDAISIATQDHLHKDIALFALSKGLHVFVEKPLDITSQGSWELVSFAEKNNLLLQIDFHKRYDPFHIEIKQLVDQGKFGKFLYGYCYMEDKIIVPRDWFREWVINTSPIWFLGSNFIDLISWIMNSKVVSVYAKGQKSKLKELGLDIYDSIQSMVSFDNDAVITFDNSWILPEQFSSIVNQGFRLVGTEGIVEADSHNRGTTSCFTSENGVRNHNSGFMNSGKDIYGREIYEGYGIKSIQHFAENLYFLKKGGCLEDLEGTYPSGKDGHEVTKVNEAIHLSLECGESVNLKSENRLVQNG